VTGGRRQNLADLLNPGTPAPVVHSEGAPAPAGAVASAPLSDFASNPRNPRRRPRAIEEMGASLVEHGQLQPVVAVTVERWLARWPEDREQFDNPDARMVTLIGTRRVLGARAGGRKGLDYVLKDHLLDHPLPLLASAMENIGRESMSCLDESRIVIEVAEHLEAELGKPPTDAQVAEKFAKSRTWVGQRRGLVRLTQAAQDLIDEHAVSIEMARATAALDADDQAPYLLAILADGQDEEVSAESDTAVSPVPEQRDQRSAKAPTRKATLRVFSGYWREHGPSGVASLLREELDAAALAELVAALTAPPDDHGDD